LVAIFRVSLLGSLIFVLGMAIADKKNDRQEGTRKHSIHDKVRAINASQWLNR